MGAAPSRNHGSIVIWMIGDNGDLSTPSQNMVSCYVRGDEPVVKNNGRALDYCSALAAVLACSGLLRDEEAAFCTVRRLRRCCIAKQAAVSVHDGGRQEGD